MEFLVVLDPIMQNLGALKFPLISISILVLIVIILLSIDTFSDKKVNVDRKKKNLQLLLILGSMNAALGMLGQIMGIWYALAAILETADISMEIVYQGLQASFGATFYGFITFFVAVIAWLIFTYIPVKK